jgi:hypothetical protein
MDEVRGGIDLVLMAVGAILAAGAMQRSKNVATTRARADVLHQLSLMRRRWQRRGANVYATIELVGGAGLMVYALVHGARSAAHTDPIDTEPLDTEPLDAQPDPRLSAPLAAAA